MMPKKAIPTISVGELKQHLSVYPDDFQLSFGGLTYYRLKTRDENLVLMEFDQLVYVDDDGNVQVDN